MGSERQRRRQARTDRFWKGKAARASTPFQAAAVAYDRARAAVADLPPHVRDQGWRVLLVTLVDLHDQWADGNDARIWNRHVPAAGETRAQVWAGWRRLWAVAHRQDHDRQPALWMVVAAELDRALLTVGDLRREANSQGAADPSTPRSRAPANVSRAKRNTTGTNSAPKNTHRSRSVGGNP